jgi:hypothetical protein
MNAHQKRFLHGKELFLKNHSSIHFNKSKYIPFFATYNLNFYFFLRVYDSESFTLARFQRMHDDNRDKKISYTQIMSHHCIIIDKKYFFNMKRMHLHKKFINLYFLAYKKKNLLAFIMSLL